MDTPPRRNMRGVDNRQCVLFDHRTVCEENTAEVHVQDDMDAAAVATATEAEADSVNIVCIMKGPLERAVAMVCRFRQWEEATRLQNAVKV